MRRSSRLFELIQTLRRARRPMPARVLAATLEVCVRTVYRDIATLQALQVPIVGEAGLGYVMRPGFDLPPLMFTADEVEAIAVGLAMLGRTGDAGLQAAAAAVAGKLADVLPAPQGRLDGLPLHVSRWSAVPPPRIDLPLLRRAIRDERKLRLAYRDAAVRDTDRTVCPIALLYYVDSVVLAGWCELRTDYRHFRVDRITSCVGTDDRFAGEGLRLRSGWPGRTALPPPAARG